MKPIHYLADSMLQNKGVAACGIYVNKQHFNDCMTTYKQDVTCMNCRRTEAIKRPEQDKCGQQRCVHDRIVGCDYTGRKHRCRCGK